MRKVLLTSSLLAVLSFGAAAEALTSYEFPTEQTDKGKKKKKKKCCSSKKSCSSKESKDKTDSKEESKSETK